MVDWWKPVSFPLKLFSIHAPAADQWKKLVFPGKTQSSTASVSPLMLLPELGPTPGSPTVRSASKGVGGGGGSHPRGEIYLGLTGGLSVTRTA